MAEEGRAQQIFVGSKVLIGTEVTFLNLGDMPYIQSEDTDNTFQFNDGYINLGVDNADFTTDFQFDFSNATEGPDGNVESFTLTRFRSAGRGETRTENADLSAGWEIGSRYDMWRLTNRITLGFTIAGGVSTMDYGFSDTINGDLFRQRVTLPVRGFGGIPIRDSGSYRSTEFGGGDYILIDDLQFDESSEELVTQVLGDGTIVTVDSEVQSIYDLRTSLGTVRTGTYFDIYLTEKLLIHLGVGISASYFSYSFSVDESLISSTLSTPYTTSDSTSGGEWMPGFYAEANLVYRLNQKTSVYAGAQKHFMEDPDSITVEQAAVDVRLGSPTMLQAGFEFDF
jgi:hypothetical protein